MNIRTIIAMILVENWLANDLHYRSFGNGFYGKHMMADRIKDFGSAVDDLKECYYLGWMNTTPEPDSVYAQDAIAMYEGIVNDSKHVLESLHKILSNIINGIEEIKKTDTNLVSGVVAILDSISQKCLTYKFLIGSEEQV